MRLASLLCAAAMLAGPAAFAQTQPSLDPHLLLTPSDFAARRALAEKEPWAKDALDKVLKRADGYPQDYLSRWGLTTLTVPEKGAQWAHWYVCPETGTQLQFHPPNHNICPDTGKDYQNWPISDVHYHYMHDQLSEDAKALAIAYRMTGKEKYAEEAAHILLMYADKYHDYPIVDNYGKQSDWGARIYSQTLNESIWLIDMTTAYDLVRGSHALSAAQRTHIENDLLLPSAQTVVRGHKEPTLNIQSWINGAEAAVGFELGNKALIDEALNGPLGFRYQMKNYVHEGFWLEGAWGYQFYAMRPLVVTAEIARRHGVNLWEQEPALASMFLAPLGVVLPNGDLPAFNDSHEVPLYPNAPLYEVAYENTHDPSLLAVLSHSRRDSMEALLFGVPELPHADASALKSAVFPDSGYAMLRAPHSDLNVIMKFGPHGGGHGHFDKLGEIVYAGGAVQGVDPGTQLYGMALHKEWDQMTVAHNAPAVDEQRQQAATGKLLTWKQGPEFAAAVADAGNVYPFGHLTRGILVTDQYALQVDDEVSTDGKPHRFDISYHNFGKETLNIQTEPYTGFPKANGYQHLEDAQRAETAKDVVARFAGENQGMTVTCLGAPGTEVFTGVAPGPHPAIKVPFLIVRRTGASARFIWLLMPDTKPAQTITAQPGPGDSIIVSGPSWKDTVHVAGAEIRFTRSR